jgi:hypothetical protein
MYGRLLGALSEKTDDWYDCEYALLLVLKRFEFRSARAEGEKRGSSSCGGGVVSIELISLSCGSEEPDAAGEGVLSLSMAEPEPNGPFIDTRTDAASSN